MGTVVGARSPSRSARTDAGVARDTRRDARTGRGSGRTSAARETRKRRRARANTSPTPRRSRQKTRRSSMRSWGWNSARPRRLRGGTRWKMYGNCAISTRTRLATRRLGGLGWAHDDDDGDARDGDDALVRTRLDRLTFTARARVVPVARDWITSRDSWATRTRVTRTATCAARLGMRMR